MPEILSTSATLLLAVFVYVVGSLVEKLIPKIKKLNLPTAVIGAFVFLPFLNLFEILLGRELVIAGGLRDILLVIFFCSMGLAVRYKEALKGGVPLLMLCILSIILVVLQNIIGVTVAMLFGYHPAYGLLAGSISYVGGFGSSLAWGTYYAEASLPFALEVGFTCSTLGLVSGGLLAGPAVAWLINRNKLGIKMDATRVMDKGSENAAEKDKFYAKFKKVYLQLVSSCKSCSYGSFLKVAIALLITIYLGDLLKPVLKDFSFDLPRFLVAMLVGIVLINIFGRGRLALAEAEVDRISDLSFNAFIILSLLGMKMSALSEYMPFLFIILIVQILITILFSTEIIYRFMGKNYDAAVLSGGVIGFGLSSLAVAVATVKTITQNHGPSPRALLLTSLVGAALIDLPNNLLIGLLTRLEFFQF